MAADRADMTAAETVDDLLSLLSAKAAWPSDLKANYLYRPQQERMAKAIYETLCQGEHLLIEAGTGTGKTLAYLLPLLRYAREENVRVVVSTETHSLQYQILYKEIPFIRAATNSTIAAELCLGAGNFVCKRRLAETINRGALPQGAPQALQELEEFLEWEKNSATGIRQEYGKSIDPRFWRSVSRDVEDCLGRRCPHYDISPYFVARRRWHKAQLLIVNHSLLASHFASGNRLLPQFNHLVIDEAHRFPEILQKYFALSIDLAETTALFGDMPAQPQALQLVQKFRQELCSHYDLAPSSYKRVRAELELQSGFRLIEMVERAQRHIQDQMEKLESQIEIGAFQSSREKKRGNERGNKGDSSAGSGSADGDAGSIGETELTVQQLRLQSRLKQLTVLYILLEKLMSGQEAGEVLWITRSSARSGRGDSIRITSMPLESGPTIHEKVISSLTSVIFTSSTLSASSDAPFRYFLDRLGFEEQDAPQCLQIESPFRYKEQALFYLPQKIADPVSSADRYYRDIAGESHRLLQLSGGGAFLLFTSILALKAVHALLNEQSHSDYTLLSQIELGAVAALAAFSRLDNGALLGLATFWQGIDIPGEKLRMVVLTRIPFQVPDEPLLAARLEAEKERGGNPFSALQLPAAILNIRQGFGRLIRSDRDRGVVALLDPRIHSRSYGRQILAALPDASQKRDFHSLQKSYSKRMTLV